MKSNNRLKDLCSYLSNESNDQLDKRVNKLYLPIYNYIISLIECNNNEPLFVGISAPQGCGKTTLTNIISQYFLSNNKICVSMSLDDFYLTGDEQDQLAVKHKDNQLLNYRGNAGTHDLDLALSVLNKLKLKKTSSSSLTTPSVNDMDIQIPKYDKSLRDGRGDRSPVSEWNQINKNCPVDVVLFEGWMLGFNSYKSINKSIDVLTDEMKTIDNYLSNYKPLDELFDCWLVLAVDDINYVFEWRSQAEREMRRSGRSAMTEEQVRDFVSRFMPAYNAYLPDLYTHGPQRKTNSPVNKIVVGFDRLPINNDISTNITSRL